MDGNWIVLICIYLFNVPLFLISYCAKLDYIATRGLSCGVSVVRSRNEAY